MIPLQAVTLVSSGGTPSQLADQRGAPYPTTGFGALVFNTGPHLIDPVIENAILGGPFKLFPGDFFNPSIQFTVDGTRTPGFYSEGPGNISLVGTNGTEASRALLASFNHPGNLIIPQFVTANGTIPSNENSQILATTAWVNNAIATSPSGTVTSVSVVTANGLAGTVATPASTPAITLSTTITGMLKGNGTAISAGVPGTDYVTPGGVPITLPPSGPAGGDLVGTYPTPFIKPSVALTGTPTAPTATPSTTSTTQIATTAFVQSALPTTLPGPPTGAAGGHLAGTYPNPTIKPGTNTQVLTTVGGVATWAAPTGGGGGASTVVSLTPPVAPTVGQLWFCSDSIAGGGQTYLWFDDGTSAQWVPVTPIPSSSGGGGAGGDFLPLTGGTLTGPLTGTTATFSSAVNAVSEVVAGTPGGGYIKMSGVGADPTHVGLLSFHTGDNVRQGYIGYGAGGIQYAAEVGYHDIYSSGGGRHNLAAGLTRTFSPDWTNTIDITAGNDTASFISTKAASTLNLGGNNTNQLVLAPTVITANLPLTGPSALFVSGNLGTTAGSSLRPFLTGAATTNGDRIENIYSRFVDGAGWDSVRIRLGRSIDTNRHAELFWQGGVIGLAWDAYPRAVEVASNGYVSFSAGAAYFGPGGELSAKSAFFTNGPLQVGTTPNGAISLNTGGAANTGYIAFYQPDGTRRGYIGFGGPSGSGIIYATDDAGSHTFNNGIVGMTATFNGGVVNINGTAGTYRQFTFQTNGVYRWTMGGADNVAESGGNAGSNFNIHRFDDAGNYLGAIFQINRASGVAQFNGALTGVNAAFSDPSGNTQILQVTGTGVNGAGIKLVGNNVNSAPNKWLRSINGQFDIINNAYSAPLLIITDAGLGTIGASPAPTSNNTEIATTAWVRANSGGAPPGAIMDYAGAAAPAGWLLCNGASYLRTDYPSLFAAIGVVYGSVDGTHFNVPDLGGRVTAGKETTATRLTTGGAGIDGSVLGASGGYETHILTVAQLAGHQHMAQGLAGTSGLAGGPNWNLAQNTGTGFAGSDQPHQNTQPTIILNKIIKT